MGSAIYFYFLSGAKKGKIERAQAGVVRLGRQPYCEIPLDPHADIPASGEHAHVVLEADGSFTLHDNGSTWGTYKNDIRIHGPVPITTGDVVTLGVDEMGTPGPRLKFYLEKDILRCASCDGPVYKRHFKCPDCRRKTCLRCVDFTHKVCKPCAERRNAAAGAYEVVEDDEPVRAKAPARVVVSGKDAERVRRAQAKKLAESGRAKDSPQRGLAQSGRAKDSPQRGLAQSGRAQDAAQRPLTQSGRSKDSPQRSLAESGRDRGSNQLRPTPEQKRTKILPGRERAAPPLDGIVAEPAGMVAEPLGMVAEPIDPLRAARILDFSSHDEEFGSEPELKVPDLSAAVQRASAPRAAVDPDALALPDLDDIDDGPEEALPRAAPVRAPGPPAAGPVIVARPDPTPHEPPPVLRAEPVRGYVLPPANKITAQRPAAIPCERCARPLAAQGFFVCERCRLRLCAEHRATESVCRECVAVARGAAAPPRPAPLPPLPPLPAPPGQPAAIPPTMRYGRPPPADGRPQWGGQPQRRLADSAEETHDDLAAPPPGSAGPAELAAMRFECPHCEQLLPATARRCTRCGQEL